MKRMNRRQFMRTIEQASVASLAPVVCAPFIGAACASVRYAQSSVERERIVVRRTELSAAGTALVETPDEQLPIFLRRVSDNEFVALSTKCTHRGCQVEHTGTQMACPCHGSVFSLEGQRLQGPADRPLQRFQVTADATNVYISRTAVSS